MDKLRAEQTLTVVTNIVNEYEGIITDYSLTIRRDTRQIAGLILDEVSMDVYIQEVVINNEIQNLYFNAHYRVARAFFQASPGLIAVLTAIYKIIKIVIDVINIIDGLLKVTTDHSLKYYIDQLIPGFQKTWDDIMNKVAEFSQAFGWAIQGVSTVAHLAASGTQFYNNVMGKGHDITMSTTYVKTLKLLNWMSEGYDAWSTKPGEALDALLRVNQWTENEVPRAEWGNFLTNIKTTIAKAETLATQVQQISGKILDLQNNMPSIVAKNIPKSVWDGIAAVNNKISTTIVGYINGINDRIDGVNAVLNAHRLKQDELSNKVAHPGDLMNEINKLPEYARRDQYDKVAAAASYSYEADRSAYMEDNLETFSELDTVKKAYQANLTPLPFMNIEFPSKPAGSTPPPKAGWFVGDY